MSTPDSRLSRRHQPDLRCILTFFSLNDYHDFSGATSDRLIGWWKMSCTATAMPRWLIWISTHWLSNSIWVVGDKTWVICHFHFAIFIFFHFFPFFSLFFSILFLFFPFFSIFFCRMVLTGNRRHTVSSRILSSRCFPESSNSPYRRWRPDSSRTSNFAMTWRSCKPGLSINLEIAYFSCVLPVKKIVHEAFVSKVQPFSMIDRKKSPLLFFR